MSCTNSVLFTANELLTHCPEISPFTSIPIGATAIGLPRTCPESSQLWESGTTVFVGDWWRTADYDRRRRIIANPPKTMAISKKAKEVVLRGNLATSLNLDTLRWWPQRDYCIEIRPSRSSTRLDARCRCTSILRSRQLGKTTRSHHFRDGFYSGYYFLQRHGRSLSRWQQLMVRSGRQTA